MLLLLLQRVLCPRDGQTRHGRKRQREVCLPSHGPSVPTSGLPVVKFLRLPAFQSLPPGPEGVVQSPFCLLPYLPAPCFSFLISLCPYLPLSARHSAWISVSLSEPPRPSLGAAVIVRSTTRVQAALWIALSFLVVSAILRGWRQIETENSQEMMGSCPSIKGYLQRYLN